MNSSFINNSSRNTLSNFYLFTFTTETENVIFDYKESRTQAKQTPNKVPQYNYESNSNLARRSG